MLRSLADLKNYKIDAIDGDIGTLHDLFFDDQEWIVRYIVIDTGSWLPGRKVLISPTAVGRATWASRHLRVLLTRDQIRDAPGISTDLPVSRQEEERLARYFAWPMYWTVVDPAAMPSGVQRDAAALSANAQPHPTPRDTHLRSLREVVGYRIGVRDGSIGHVDDIIGDDHDWMIRYLVVDTRNWLPGKHVLVSPMWIDRVDWNQAQVNIDLPRDEIKEAPPYDPSAPINRAYEERLYDYYGRPVYWSDAPIDVQP